MLRSTRVDATKRGRIGSSFSRVNVSRVSFGLTPKMLVMSTTHSYERRKVLCSKVRNPWAAVTIAQWW